MFDPGSFSCTMTGYIIKKNQGHFRSTYKNTPKQSIYNQCLDRCNSSTANKARSHEMDMEVLMMGIVRLILKACPWIIVGSVFGLAAL